ncbi:hypothetical protein DRO24_01670 [Candidatus Bathyarchaeota archaeon]|nr:MAG: hypothetical protein DRO24_01670 [Candidatus Bathyarchaeota archaeon]
MAVMATDAGVLEDGEEVISLAGTYKGLDTAALVKTTYSGRFFEAFEVLEVLAKPRYPNISLPEYRDKKWKGIIDQYYEPIKLSE